MDRCRSMNKIQIKQICNNCSWIAIFRFTTKLSILKMKFIIFIDHLQGKLKVRYIMVYGKRSLRSMLLILPYFKCNKIYIRAFFTLGANMYFVPSSLPILTHSKVIDHRYPMQKEKKKALKKENYLIIIILLVKNSKHLFDSI